MCPHVDCVIWDKPLLGPSSRTCEWQTRKLRESPLQLCPSGFPTSHLVLCDPGPWKGIRQM